MLSICCCYWGLEIKRFYSTLCHIRGRTPHEIRVVLTQSSLPSHCLFSPSGGSWAYFRKDVSSIFYLRCLTQALKRSWGVGSDTIRVLFTVTPFQICNANTISAALQSSGPSGAEGFISLNSHCERLYHSNPDGLRWMSSGYLIFQRAQGRLLSAGVVSNTK